MADFLTRLCILGAAVSFAAWVFLVNWRRIAQFHEFVSRIPPSQLAAFLAFVLVATVVAQKRGGTNEVLRTTEHTEYTETADGGVPLRNGSNVNGDSPAQPSPSLTESPLPT